jgi:hypothetical protein
MFQVVHGFLNCGGDVRPIKNLAIESFEEAAPMKQEPNAVCLLTEGQDG